MDTKIDLEKFRLYERSGLITGRNHPILDLIVWNYTAKTQHEYVWDDITSIARGLITDKTGFVIAKPFPKFFNIEEERHTPTKQFEAFEKMDGSLGIVCMYQNQIVCSTRGSFESDQAKMASDFIKRERMKIAEGCTYLFEIVSPQNRIVVNYENEDLVLLSIYDHVKNKEVEYEKLSDYFTDYSPTIVKRYDGIKDYTKLKALNTKNAEGFVIRFTNGDRCKIKFKDYVKLHHIIFGLSTVSIWENLRTNTILSNKNIPEESLDKINIYKQELEHQFFTMEFRCRFIFNMISQNADRKDFAREALKHPELSPILFGMLDNKDVSDIIWKKIKPEYSKL